VKRRSALVVVVPIVIFACGRDVDIGGATDTTSPVDAAVDAPLAECDPCLGAAECGPFATCVAVGGSEGFCVTRCPQSTECDNDDACQVSTTVSGEKVAACIPKTNACALAAPPPPTADGAPLERCGEIFGPTLSAACHSCEKTSPSCQKNGCYGGWWCNTDTRRCQRPPASCP
jgi:hypothetical protein